MRRLPNNLSHIIQRLVVAAGAAWLLSIVADPCAAITVGQIDDFQDGTSQNWVVNVGFGNPIAVGNESDAGPEGAGDHALIMDTVQHGGGRLVVTNVTQWTGNWTAAGVTQIGMDVRNPNDFELSMRLGIAGPGGVFAGGSGDTYVSGTIAVPDDDAWHSITFDVQAENFIPVGGTEIDAALADVTHLRLFNADPFSPFLGAFGGAFYLDNIQALGPTVLDGDFNRDGIVGAADYTVWRDGLGDEFGLDDFDVWKANFGSTPAATGSGLAVSNVPEPATLLLCLAGLSILVAARATMRCRKESAN